MRRCGLSVVAGAGCRIAGETGARTVTWKRGFVRKG